MMDYGLTIGFLHQFVGWLLYPVLMGLAFAILLTLWELGVSVAEKIQLHQAKARLASGASKEQLQNFELYAQKRLERADLLSRSGPILGLMGTLIPLGPGLAALGEGNLDILATAIIVAFDTTVLGLLVGLVAYAISRMRRRWYESHWNCLQQEITSEA